MSDFFRNLWADLRDRGLLPIIGLLVVALIAIPLLLGSGGSDSVAPPPAGPASASAAPLPGIETRPVVIASPAELRSYKKRLAAFNSRNPFHPNGLKKGPGDGSGSGSDSTVPSATSTDPGVTGTTTTPESTPTTPAGTSVPPSNPTGPSGSDGSSGNDGSSGGQLISIRIDVEAGKAGHLKEINDVKSLDFLPDPQHPVVQYIGGDFDLTKAAFVVSSGIEATHGEGKCAPSPDNCQFLMLKVGQTQHFVYRAEKYDLKLVEVKEHVTPLKDSAEPSSKQPDEPRGSVRKGFNAVKPAD
jgi:hypothetical protein